MNNKLTKQCSVSLPSTYGHFELLAYSEDTADWMPHLVLVSKSLNTKETVNVRIHSECITGDLFGSLRCECGEQLNSALDYIKVHQGILIYLRQEGRGIGIINKIKAYVEQDKGYDTAEANIRLGFEADNRNYGAAIDVLEDLGISRINLLTNNPTKIKAFADSTIQVLDRIPLEITPHHHNENYLKTKKTFFGHLLKSV